jgi:hypothetical protein
MNELTFLSYPPDGDSTYSAMPLGSIKYYQVHLTNSNLFQLQLPVTTGTGCFPAPSNKPDITAH